MSEQDIIERLRGYYSTNDASPEAVLVREAADAIAVLRYDHQRDAEKIAGLMQDGKNYEFQLGQLYERIKVLERLCGAVSNGPSYRETTKDMKHWPEVGTHE